MKVSHDEDIGDSLEAGEAMEVMKAGLEKQLSAGARQAKAVLRHGFSPGRVHKMLPYTMEAEAHRLLVQALHARCSSNGAVIPTALYPSGRLLEDASSTDSMVDQH